MTIAPHAIIGAAVSTFTGNIWVAFFLGILSHFVADFLPHVEPKSLVTKDEEGNKHWSIWLFVFVAVEFAFTVYVLQLGKDRPDFPLLVAGAFGGLFPDFIANNPFLQNLRLKPVFKQIFWFHDFMHCRVADKYWQINLLVELLVVGGALWFLLR